MNARDFRELMDEEEGNHDATQDAHSAEYEGDSMAIIGYMVVVFLVLAIAIGWTLWPK